MRKVCGCIKLREEIDFVKYFKESYALRWNDNKNVTR